MSILMGRYEAGHNTNNAWVWGNYDIIRTVALHNGNEVDLTENTISLRGNEEKMNLISLLSSPYPPVTLTAHFTASAVSSDTTMSTHFRLGARSLRICFLTIASKARSGVKRPVLKGSESDVWKQRRKDILKRREGRKKEEERKIVCSVSDLKSEKTSQKRIDKPQLHHIHFC